MKKKINTVENLIAQSKKVIREAMCNVVTNGDNVQIKETKRLAKILESIEKNGIWRE